MFETEIALLLTLFCVALVAGCIDAIAGGGGLIVVPALLLSGVPPLTALGTNKFQGLFGSGSAAFKFLQSGHLDLRANFPSAVACGVASIIGAMIAARLDDAILAICVPIILIIVALYFILQPGLDQPRTARLTPTMLSFAALPMIGFYDGIFGPGAGSFYMVILTALGGFGMIAATARTKLVNFASNLGGFLLFASIGAVAWKIGAVMALGQIIGGRLGAAFAIQNGARIIRPLLVFMTIAMALKLISERIL